MGVYEQLHLLPRSGMSEIGLVSSGDKICRLPSTTNYQVRDTFGCNIAQLHTFLWPACCIEHDKMLLSLVLP